MLLSVLENFLLGVAISALPGAVFLETLRRVMNAKSTVNAFLVGNFIGIIVIVLMVFFGVALFFSNQIFSLLFYLLSGGILLYIGLSSMFVRSIDSEKRRFIKKKKSTIAGVGIGLTLAIANPASIMFWIAVIGKLLHENDSNGAIIAVASIVLGALSFFTVFVYMASQLSSRIKPCHLLILSRGFGGLIFIYGVATLSNIAG